MVTFNELRITENGEYLIIDVKIRKDIIEQYSNAYIKNIWVCDSEHYTEGTPTDAINIYTYIEGGLKKKTYYEAKLFTEFGTKKLNGKLLFVYVEVAGADAPCGCASNPAIGVALDMGIIYRQFMKYIDELSCSNKCSSKMPQGFTDFILRFNALLLAMDSKHYKKGVEFFNKWFNKSVNSFKKDCGCNG